MNRPPSIVRFEQLWWGATAAWLVGTILSWKRTELTLAADPRTAPAAGIVMPITIGVTLAAAVLLWWLAARRASPVGKWLVAIVAGFSAVQGVIRLVAIARAPSVHPVSLIALLLDSVLTVAAAAMLFRADAAIWFGIADDVELEA